LGGYETCPGVKRGGDIGGRKDEDVAAGRAVDGADDEVAAGNGGVGNAGTLDGQAKCAVHREVAGVPGKAEERWHRRIDGVECAAVGIGAEQFEDGIGFNGVDNEIECATVSDTGKTGDEIVGAGGQELVVIQIHVQSAAGLKLQGVGDGERADNTGSCAGIDDGAAGGDDTAKNGSVAIQRLTGIEG